MRRPAAAIALGALLVGVLLASLLAGSSSAQTPPTSGSDAQQVTLRVPRASQSPLSRLVPVGEIGTGALASRPAVRSAPVTVGSTCDLETVRAIAARHPAARQLIVTRTPSWSSTSGTLDVAVHQAGEWRCQRGGQVAMVGRAGSRPLVERRSGDGTAPAGVFPLGTTTAWDGQSFQFFGNAPDPGVRGTYRAVRPGDCWGARPGQATYNHLYRSTTCPAPDEYLPRITGAYSHAAVIGANTEPSVSGDAPGEVPYAAAIFLHRHAYTTTGAVKPTSGCVSLAIEDLVPVLTLIDPALQPHFAIGPTDWLRSTA